MEYPSAMYYKTYNSRCLRKSMIEMSLVSFIQFNKVKAWQYFYYSN